MSHIIFIITFITLLILLKVLNMIIEMIHKKRKIENESKILTAIAAREVYVSLAHIGFYVL